MFLHPKSYILNSSRASRGGQSMILMVLILTGTLLSVAMISGLVMLSQIRQAGNISKSAQAIFAAETGVEWWRMSIKNPASTPLSSTINSILITDSNSSFEIFPVAGNPNQTKIIGTAGNSKRAFLATITPPSAACGPDSDVVLVLQDTNTGIVNLPDYQNSVRSFANGLLTASPNIYIGEFAFEDPAGLKFRLENNGPLTLPKVPAGLNIINTVRNLSSGISRAFAELTTDPAIPPVNLTYIKNYTTTPNFIVIVAYNSPDRPLVAFPQTPRTVAKIEADQAKAAGITIIVVGVNVPTNFPVVPGTLEDFLMNDIASPGNYFLATGFDPIAVGELGKVLLNQVLPLIDCP